MDLDSRSPRYAAVAFGLPCTIDDSDVNVAEIDDSTPSIAITYQRLKGRLYRIMGPFLGRKRQPDQLQGLPEIHARLKAWYQTITGPLRWDLDDQPDETQARVTQMQAIALHLAYDNLQIVLHRQAIFPKDPKPQTHTNRELSLSQLLESAIRTSKVSQYAATDYICRSSHAAMHVGICSFSAGVVLCALLAGPSDNMLSSSDTTAASTGLDQIISLFENFPAQSYRLAQESLQILKALRAKLSYTASNVGA
jgi:hypothetical protein